MITNILSLILIVACALSVAAQAEPDAEVLQRTSAQVAVVLVGDGEGVVVKIAPAVVIGADGVLLVPYHVVKDAKQVQVRLRSDEIFDEVTLLGTDVRRDTAAIRIQASDLPMVEPVSLEDLKSGGPAIVYTHVPGSLWSVSTGRLGELRLADEIAGAGQGFRVVQLDLKIGPNVDGGILFDSEGRPVGLLTEEFVTTKQKAVAVPISNVRALGSSGKSRTFGGGNELQLPSQTALDQAKNPSNDPKDLLLNSKTVYVETRTSFFKEQQLINELNKRKEIKEWGWILTTGSYEARNKADLIIGLDHQILSFDFTFAVRHRKSSVVISAGKVVIADGASGAPKMVDKIIKSLQAVIAPVGPKTKK